MLLNERLYTADEFWELCQLPENADKHWELIEGVIQEMSPGNWLHGKIIGLLTGYLMVYLLENPLGDITAAETGYRVAEDIVLAPDIGFIAKSRIPEHIPEKYVPFAPDIAVEVVSPGNSQLEISTKIELYLQYGTRLVWIIYPKRATIHVYRAGNEATSNTFSYLGINDTLSGEDVLPNFSLSLAKLFA